MKRTNLLTSTMLVGLGLVALLSQSRLQAEEPSPRQRRERPEEFRGPGRPGMSPGDRREMREMRDQVLRRFDDIIQRLERIERRLSGAPGAHAPRPEGSFRGMGPRPSRPEGMHGRHGFGPGVHAPGHRMPQHGKMSRPGWPFDRSNMPEELRQRMKERMQQGWKHMEERQQQARKMMEQARGRMDQARPEGPFRGMGPRPSRPEGMHGRHGFGPGTHAPGHRMPQHGKMNRPGRPFDRSNMPEELRQRMKERMQQGGKELEERKQQARKMMEQGRGRMDQARREGSFRGMGPRPSRPEGMHGRHGFGPGAHAPGHRMPQHGKMNQPGRPLDRSNMPEELRQRMKERMQQGGKELEERKQQARKMMEQARGRIDQARQKFTEMQERLERLEAEVKRLQKAGHGHEKDHRSKADHKHKAEVAPAQQPAVNQKASSGPESKREPVAEPKPVAKKQADVVGTAEGEVAEQS